MKIKFTANSLGKPPEYQNLDHWQSFKKLADCEVHFEEGEPLAGYKLEGFVIAERIKPYRDIPIGNLTVYAPNYQTRKGGASIALLRPVDDDDYGYGVIKGELKDLVLSEYRQWAKPKRGRARKLLDKVVSR